MASKEKIKTEEVKNFFQKLPMILAENGFLLYLVLFFLSLLFGGFLFYKYNYSVKKMAPAIQTRPLQFAEEDYKKILENWQKKEERFKEADSKKYPDPFKQLTNKKN